MRDARCDDLMWLAVCSQQGAALACPHRGPSCGSRALRPCLFKFAEKHEFERANEIKKRIKSLDLMRQEQSFNSALTSIDFFTCISKLDRTGVCILSVRDGKIRGTKNPS